MAEPTLPVLTRAMWAKYGRPMQELSANTVPNSHIVAAGIVAVNRAQEKGYTFSYVG